VTWYASSTLAASPWRTPDSGAHRDAEVVQRQKVAEFLRKRTREDARVFYYGIDPYTLYLAKRLPADPHIVSFEVNFGPATSAPPSRGGPTRKQREAIDELQARAANKLCTRLREVRPQALVFDVTRRDTGPDAVEDVLRLCPAFRDELAKRYELAQRFGKLRIYLRR